MLLLSTSQNMTKKHRQCTECLHETRASSSSSLLYSTEVEGREILRSIPRLGGRVQKRRHRNNTSAEFFSIFDTQHRCHIA